VGDALKNNGAANLTVEPNVVFSRSGTLTAADADALMEWAYGKQITDDLSFLDYAPTLEYPALLQALKDRYSDYETLGAYNDLRIVAMLMARFGLKATGLFDQQLGDVIPHGSWITGDTFLPAMTSVAKDYGIWLHAVLPHDATYTVSPVKGKGIAQKMRLGIWELSYCNLDAPYICFDPRVGAQPGPYMVFVLYSAQTASALAANEASNKELQPGTAVPYMASDWMAAQFG
jgi:hypothetical protein